MVHHRESAGVVKHGMEAVSARKAGWKNLEVGLWTSFTEKNPVFWGRSRETPKPFISCLQFHVCYLSALRA